MGEVTIAKTKNGKTVLKSLRIPQEIVEILSADAKAEGRTLTELQNSLFERYVRFDRLARKFGFVTVSRGTWREIMDALPEERVRELAISQSDRIEELALFWFNKKDLDAVLSTIDMFSRYLRLCEYTTSRTDREIVVTVRTDLGRNSVLFASLYFERALAKILGGTPKVVVAGELITIKLPLKGRMA